MRLSVPPFLERRVILLVSEISSIDLQLHILISASMFNQAQSEFARRLQKPPQTPRRNERIHSKIEEAPYEPIASPARASTPSALKQRPKIQDKEASQTTPEVEIVTDFEVRAAKYEDVQPVQKAEEMTAKKSTKGKKSPLTSQKKAKHKERPKQTERVNASISPIKSAPKPDKNKKDNLSCLSGEGQQFFRKRKLELTEPQDKSSPYESEKGELQESAKDEKGKKEHPRLTPERSRPILQLSSDKEYAREVIKSEKVVEEELLHQVNGMQFKEVLEVDVSEDGTLVYLAAFSSEQELSLKPFEAQELARLGKLLGTELRYDFLKHYLVEACPKK